MEGKASMNNNSTASECTSKTSSHNDDDLPFADKIGGSTLVSYNERQNISEDRGSSDENYSDVFKDGNESDYGDGSMTKTWVMR